MHPITPCPQGSTQEFSPSPLLPCPKAEAHETFSDCVSGHYFPPPATGMTSSNERSDSVHIWRRFVPSRLERDDPFVNASDDESFNDDEVAPLNPPAVSPVRPAVCPPPTDVPPL